MAGQPVGSVHVNQVLSNLAIRYAPALDQLIADQVAPYLPVVHESDSYYVFTQGDLYRTAEEDLVADRAEPREVEFNATTATYQTKRRELAWSVSDRERKNADDQLRLEWNKQTGVLGQLMLKRELRVATALQKSNVTGGQLTLGAAAGAKWDNAATTYANIMSDIIIGKAAVRAVIGMNPNTIVIPAGVAEGMQKSLFYTAFANSLSDGREVLVSEQYPAIPGIISGMRVLIPAAISNTAKESVTDAYSDIWGETVRLLYVNPNSSIENPSVMYTFRSEPLTTRQWRLDANRVDKFATGQTIDERVIAASAGYAISDCLT